MPAARILVVDNEGIIAQNIENNLSQAGYMMLGIVLSGEDAIKLSHELRPDLILVDIVMEPALDALAGQVDVGLEHFALLEKLRASTKS